MSKETVEADRAERLADDLLVGARAIAEELGLDPHQVYYLAENARLPIGRLGKNLIASRRALKRAMHSITS